MNLRELREEVNRRTRLRKMQQSEQAKGSTAAEQPAARAHNKHDPLRHLLRMQKKLKGRPPADEAEAALPEVTDPAASALAALRQVVDGGQANQPPLNETPVETGGGLAALRHAAPPEWPGRTATDDLTDDGGNRLAALRQQSAEQAEAESRLMEPPVALPSPTLTAEMLERVRTESGLHPPEPDNASTASAATAPVAPAAMPAHVQMLAAEIVELRRKEKLKEIEINELRAEVAAAREALSRTKQHISYKIGQVLVKATGSPGQIVQLPRQLVDIYRSSKALKAQREERKETKAHALASVASGLKASKQALEIVRGQGLDAALQYLGQQTISDTQRARALADLGRVVVDLKPARAAELAREAIQLAPEPLVKRIAFLLLDHGHYVAAADILDRAAALLPFNQAETRRAEVARGMRRFFTWLDSHQVAPLVKAETEASRIVFYARESLPFHTRATSFQIESRMRAVTQAGLPTVAMTPPGYPGRSAVTQIGSSTAKYSGFDYVRLRHAQADRDVLDDYVIEAAASIAAAVRAASGRILHANVVGHEAMAAALAARTCGVPFVLEISDLAQLSRAQEEQTDAFHLQLRATIKAASLADRCIVQAPLIQTALQRAGIAPEKLVFLPDSFGGKRFTPAPGRDEALAQELGLGDAPVFGCLGQIGSAPDVYAEALSLLHTRHPKLRLLLIAPGGQAERRVRDVAAAHGLGDSLVILDKFNPERLARYYSLFDVCALVRPTSFMAATETPYSIYEAMAFGVPVVATSGLKALGAIQPGVTGLVAGDDSASGLAALIDRLLSEPGQRLELAVAGRAQMRHAHGDAGIGQTLAELYATL